MVLAAPPAPGLSGAEIALRLDAMRWLHRVSYHLWRLETHMDVLNQGVAPASLHRAAVMEGLSD